MKFCLTRQALAASTPASTHQTALVRPSVRVPCSTAATPASTSGTAMSSPLTVATPNSGVDTKAAAAIAGHIGAPLSCPNDRPSR
jgi:hypothetical protein